MDFSKVKTALKAVKKYLTTQQALDARLLEAVKKDDMAKALAAIADGANPSSGGRSWDIDSPLLYAIDADNAPMVKALLAAKADPNKKIGYSDETPFTEAAQKGNVEIMTALIDAGAKLNTKGDRGNTAFSRAVAARNLPLIALLVEKGAAVDTFNKYGWSPLSYATRNGDVATMTMLLEKGARTDRLDTEGRSLSDIAQEGQQWTALRTLQDHGDAKVATWQKLADADEVANVSIMRDLGYRLTQVFNTRTARLTTITHNFETGRDETVVRPLTAADKPAVDEAVKQLGALKPPVEQKPVAPAPKPAVQP